MCFKLRILWRSMSTITRATFRVHHQWIFRTSPSRFISWKFRTSSSPGRRWDSIFTLSSGPPDPWNCPAFEILLRNADQFIEQITEVHTSRALVLPATVIPTATLIFGNGFTIAAGSASFSANLDAGIPELPVDHCVHTRLDGYREVSLMTNQACLAKLEDILESLLRPRPCFAWYVFRSFSASWAIFRLLSWSDILANFCCMVCERYRVDI